MQLVDEVTGDEEAGCSEDGSKLLRGDRGGESGDCCSSA